MSEITLEVATQHRDAWLAASLALAGGQEYELSVGTTRRKLTRVDAVEVRKMLNYWEGRVKQLTHGTRRVRYGVSL